MNRDKIFTLSGKNLEELTCEGILSGDLKPEDFRISSETLRFQADAAEAAGYQRLALNLRRAAELTEISNEEVFEIYNNLRPGRATYRNLIEIADRLEKKRNAPLTAALVREAAEAYRMRGLIRKG
jgi:propanediol dehydratase small subunit